MSFLSTVLWYNKPNKSKNHTRHSIYYLVVQKIELSFGISTDFYIHNSVQITKDSDNGSSDNRGSTVFGKVCYSRITVVHMYQTMHVLRHLHASTVFNAHLHNT